MADDQALAALVVEMRLNMSKFEDGLNQVSKLSKRTADDVDKSFGSLTEGRAGLKLVEESLSISVPKHLNTLLAQIPGVATAFSYMLPIAGVAIAIEIVGKLIEKHEALQAAIRKAALEATNLAINQDDETRSLQLTNLKLDDQIAKLEHKPTHNYLKEAFIESANAMDKLAERFAANFQKMNTDLTESTGLWQRFKSAISDSGGSMAGLASAIAGNVLQVDAVKKVQQAMLDVEAARRKMADAPAGSDEWRQDTIKLANAYKTLETAATSATPAMMELSEQLKMASVASTAASAYKDMGLEIEASAKRVVIAGLEEIPIIDLRGRKSTELTTLLKKQAKERGDAALAEIDANTAFTKAINEGYEKELAEHKAVLVSLAAVAEARIKAASAGQRTDVGDEAKAGIISKQAEANAIHAIDVTELNDYIAIQQQKLAVLKETADAAVAASNAASGPDKIKAEEAATKAQLQYNEAVKQTVLTEQQLTDKVKQSAAAAASLQSSWATYFNHMKTSTAELGVSIRENLQASMDKVVSSVSSGFAKMIVEGKGMGAAMKALGIEIAESFIAMITEMAIKYVLSLLVRHTADKIAGLSEIGTQAAVAGAGGVASMAAAPFPLDMGAPAFGAAMFADAFSYAAALPASQGALIGGSTSTGTHVIAHGQELILPAHISNGLQAMIKGGSSGHTFNINLDLRGAAPGVSQEIHRAMKVAVAHAVSAVNDRASRRT